MTVARVGAGGPTRATVTLKPQTPAWALKTCGSVGFTSRMMKAVKVATSWA
ncbi:hypothetical protein HEK616_84810 (plasmid) [Streptomyces nigrescens]|uniref:Uncharacterized protein n=1 Tax=Streptomyces nigrescens TaxID=1920 RepID=A0ABM8A8J4_STRNI|nr:hypothetical protein HEK616_84810 [Streptomyces nigrescens]